MPRTLRSPPCRSANISSLLETQSEPDLSADMSTPTPTIEPITPAKITTRPGKRFRGEESFDKFEEPESDKFEELKNVLLSWKADQDIILNKLVAEVAELKLQNTSIQKSNLEIEKSISFINTSYEEMKTRLEDLERERIGYEKRLCDLENRCSEKIVATLEAKIDLMEQQARQCNIEICNLPDKRNENLLTIFQAIGTALNFPVSQNDILSISRVPHARQGDNKPKNIIIKLKSRILRDNLISAYRKKKTLKSDELGISGGIQPVYINEHLTLKNKALFRKCKEAARKHGFKYIWIKNATILVRERDGATAFAVRSEIDLNKIIANEKTAA
ncbi:hypothetical protein B5X24_HaOG213560 [Helicoverpa armigera]|nr:hypothetical protein B5X24_HaOG213560 [Helicoverpa armigera]